MLEFKINSKAIKNKVILRDVNFSISQGETILIAGPSGCGKSTLLSIIRGASFQGSMKKPEDLRIRFISQKLSINKNETPYNAVEADIKMLNPSYRIVELKDRAYDYLWAFGLGECKDRKIYLLSGGEQRRTMLAQRCACDNYDLMLADEPDSSLDCLASHTALSYLVKTVKNDKKSLVVVSHTMNNQNVKLFDKVLLMGKDEYGSATLRYYGSPSAMKHKFGTEDFFQILKVLDKVPEKKVSKKGIER